MGTISKKTAERIWVAYREIEAGEKILADIENKKSEWGAAKDEYAPTLSDAFGRTRYFQLGIPSGESGAGRQEIQVTDKQIELARHALGLPNDRNKSYRNHFCTQSDDSDWVAMVGRGDAVKRESILLQEGSVTFHLTHEGATAALKGEEKLSEEDAVIMRKLSAKATTRTAA